MREFTITASEVGTVCGISKFVRPKSLWEAKLNEWSTSSNNESTDFGKQTEYSVVREYEKITGNNVIYPGNTLKSWSD